MRLVAPVFLDTSGLFALLNENDVHHDRAHELMHGLAAQSARTVTTDWVLAELLGLASGRQFRRVAAPFVRALMDNPGVQVVTATRAGMMSALRLYETRPDKEWSLVDCHSILTCGDRGIAAAFTADHHFAQAGLSVMLA